MKAARILKCATAFFIVLLSAVHAQEDAQPQLKQAPLIISTATGAHSFTVELALSERQRDAGLMFREKLGENEGMLFDFAREQVVAMWMKNTKLPLDMVFISSDGTVSKVVSDATPYSLAIISSGLSVRAVLELPAGTAKKIGVKIGNKVQAIIFGNAPSVNPTNPN